MNPERRSDIDNDSINTIVLSLKVCRLCLINTVMTNPLEMILTAVIKQIIEDLMSNSEVDSMNLG